MSRFYFEDHPERLAVLRREAAEWLRTPFVPRGTVKGVGVDCISLCALIYKATGLISDFNPPPYSMDGGSHLAESALEREINASGRGLKAWIRPEADLKKMIDFGPLTMPGDLLCAKLGRVTHHAALVLSRDLIIQALAGSGVAYGSLRDPFINRRVHTIYRPLEASFT